MHASTAGLFSGLARLSTTGTVQLKAKKEDKKVPTTKDGRDDSVVRRWGGGRFASLLSNYVWSIKDFS